MRSQYLFDRVRELRDAALLDHPRSALERVRLPQQLADHLALAAPLLELEHARAHVLEQLVRLDAKVLMEILSHPSCVRSRLDEPDELARQARELGGGLQGLTRAGLGFTGRLRDRSN